MNSRQLPIDQAEPGRATVQAEIQGGRLSEALILQQAAILSSPQSARDWHTLGIIHEKLGALGDARAAYEEALRLQSENGAFAVALARAELALGMETSASARVRELRPEQLTDVGAAEECICHLLEVGDVTGAVYLLEKVAPSRGTEMRLAAACLIGGHAQLGSMFFRAASERFHGQAGARCSEIPCDRPKIELAQLPVDVAAEGRPGDMVIEVRRGRAQIAFTAAFRELSRTARPRLLRRAAVTLPLVWGAASFFRGEQTFYVSLSDRGVPNMISFCGRDESYLIPDPDFMASFGYDSFRRGIASRLEDWWRRRAAVIWRGTANGFLGPRPKAYGTDFAWSPRLNLCQKAQQSRYAYMLDIGITKLPDPFRGGPISERKKLERFIKPYVPVEEQMQCKYVVDIDGWANAWSGLFKKLLVGSVVLKVSSSRGYKQWYYNRLLPFENFVPVSADISDLDDAILWAESHPKEAEQIAANAQELANSMTFAKEAGAAVRRVADIGNS